MTETATIGKVMTYPKTLVEKLAEACDAVGGVEKKGRNEAQRYDYVKAADVAKAIRHELFERGIVIIPDELECVTKQITYQNAKGEIRFSNEVTLRTAYTITNGLETLIMHGYGIAWDSGDKAIYKAKTGALKYFLRGLGLIPDEKDDPEADESVDRVSAEIEEKLEKQDRIAPFQVNAFNSACNQTGKTPLQVSTFLAELNNYTSISECMKQDFDAAIKWAVKRTEAPANLTPVLQQSVDHAKKLKEQAYADAAESRKVNRDKPSYDATRTISEPQGKRLWAIATKVKKDRQTVHNILGNFGYEHVEEIQMKDYDKVISEIEAQ